MTFGKPCQGSGVAGAGAGAGERERECERECVCERECMSVCVSMCVIVRELESGVSHPAPLVDAAHPRPHNPPKVVEFRGVHRLRKLHQTARPVSGYAGGVREWST